MKGQGKVKAARRRADDYFEKVAGTDEERRGSEEKSKSRKDEGEKGEQKMTREEVNTNQNGIAVL